jgi:hypothetical protein
MADEVARAPAAAVESGEPLQRKCPECEEDTVKQHSLHAAGIDRVGLLGHIPPASDALLVQRACGQAISTPEDCAPSEGDILDFGASSDDLFLFVRECDHAEPAEMARLEAVAARFLSAGGGVAVHGFASEEGDPLFNEPLSCARANTAARVIRGAVPGSSPVITLFQHGPTPGDRTPRRSVVIEWPRPSQGSVPTSETTQPVPPSETTLPEAPAECPAGPRETAPDCTPNPHGAHLPPVGGTHTESHAFAPCLHPESFVASSPDWCVDQQQAHGGEVCYREIPATDGGPGDQYCYSLNCCHNSADLVSVASPSRVEHGLRDVIPEALDDPGRVAEDIWDSLTR